MSETMKNYYFPVPKRHYATLHGYGVEESFETGTLGFVPTMLPIPPQQMGGQTMGEEVGEETLEELEESLEFIECMGKCRKKRRGGRPTPVELSRMQDAAKGALRDVLYRGDPARGGSLHGGVVSLTPSRGEGDRGDNRNYEDAYEDAQREISARRSVSARKGALTRKKNELRRLDPDVDIPDNASQEDLENMLKAMRSARAASDHIPGTNRNGSDITHRDSRDTQRPGRHLPRDRAESKQEDLGGDPP
tara:strand:+ start:779 stop:1525 length:747 start_codon:yes stop_codon:yes gene_type:complete